MAAAEAPTRSQVVRLRDNHSQALSVAFAQIESLRRQLAEAQELNEQTQSFDASAMKADNKRLRHLLDEERQRASSAEEALQKQLAETRHQLEMVTQQLATTAQPRVAPSTSDGMAGSSISIGQHNAAISALRQEHEKDRRSWRKFKKWMKVHHPELLAPAASDKAKLAATSQRQPAVAQPAFQPAPSQRTTTLPATTPSSATLRVQLKAESSSPCFVAPPEPVFAPVAGPSKLSMSPLRLAPSRRSSSISDRHHETPILSNRRTVPIYAELGEPPLPAARWRDIDEVACLPPSSGKRRRVLKEDDESRGAAEAQEAKRRRLSARKSRGESVVTQSEGKKRRVEPEELHPGQNFLDEVRRKRKKEVMANPDRYKIKKKTNSDTPRPLRQEYEIDPERNEGRDYAFQDVVRKKDERKKLHGGDCECCTEYYLKANEDDPARAQAHRQAISRHRAHWQAPNSPPQYWQMGFPSTAQVEDINREAEERRIQKEQKIAADVEAGQGRYRKKQ